MNRDPVDHRIAARARSLFERASDGIDAATAARLQRARREALRPRSRPAAWPRWLPAGVAAALVVALAFAWRTPPMPPTPTPDSLAQAPAGSEPAPAAAAPAPADEIERLLETEDPDLYAWLAEAPVATSAGTTP